MIILAASVILSLNSSGIIGKASEAKIKSDVAELQSAYEVARVEAQLYKDDSLWDEKLEELNSAIPSYLKSYITITEDGIEFIWTGADNDTARYIKEQLDLNYIPELEDSRLGNEDIIITTSEQMYALGIILTHADYMSVNYADYLNELDFPDSWADMKASEKRSALRTASYRLENDIELEMNHDTDGEKFLGLGLAEGFYFAGFFNGNGHTITLSCATDTIEVDNDILKYGCGIFGYTNNATITNLQVDVKDDIIVASNPNVLALGAVVGRGQSTILYDVDVNVSDAIIGIDYNNSSNRNTGYVGALIGRCDEGVDINYCNATLENNSKLSITTTVDSDTYFYSIGGLVGGTVVSSYTSDRVNISNSTVYLNNSGIEQTVPQIGYTGGFIGRVDYTTISDCEVICNNSSIGAQAIEKADSLTSYYTLATGGIAGWTAGGSDNTNNIGGEGVTIKNTKFESTNDSKIDVLYSKETYGGSPNVGGIVGVTFNNASVVNCEVSIDNGRIIAQRTGENESVSTYGATVGGIAGRLEHTSKVQSCKVVGNNLDVIAESTEQKIYCGGIVGVDVGPNHRKIISLYDNEFVGNGTSNIEVKLIPGSATNTRIYVGGIVASGTYIIKDCNISGTTIKHTGTNANSLNAAASKIVAYFENTSANSSWKKQTYWTPDTEGVYNCTSENVTISVSGTGNVVTGDIIAKEVAD